MNAEIRTGDTTPARAQIGDQRVSYLMQPCGANGQPLNNGMSYANANTIDDARAYATRVLTNGLMGMTVHSVQITGHLYRLGLSSWEPVTGRHAQYTSETLSDLAAAPTEQ